MDSFEILKMVCEGVNIFIKDMLSNKYDFRISLFIRLEVTNILNLQSL